MFEKLPEQIRIVEVGPRDGLQNEEKLVPTEDKARLIESLARAGLKHIEATSFVSPKWIPQLADGLDLIKSLNLPKEITVSALVPNMKGYESAVKAGIEQISIFMSASEAHSKKNINKTVAEAIATMSEVTQAAKKDGKTVRCYVSVVFECPYEGLVSPDKVVEISQRLMEIGVDEISLGDTIGAAVPTQVTHLIERISKYTPQKNLALHFHDTRGTALANVLAGIESGITTFDASIGGMGGCPYAPGAAGNLASEDLVYMLEGMGIKTGVDLKLLTDSGALAQEIIGRTLPGRYLKAALAARAKQAVCR